jgi:hypothetical protein
MNAAEMAPRAWKLQIHKIEAATNHPPTKIARNRIATKIDITKS